jgi:hypothetical protein
LARSDGGQGSAGSYIGPAMAATLVVLVALQTSAVAAASQLLAKGPPASHWTAINPCLNQSSPFAKQKWCDGTVAIDERVDDMIGRMTLPEKIGSLASSKNPVPSLGLPSYAWRSEANNGIDYYSSTPPTPHSTKFGWPTTTAMSFNRSLFAAIGAQVGREARAMANVGHAAGTFWHPVVNLAREPRWGRCAQGLLLPARTHCCCCAALNVAEPSLLDLCTAPAVCVCSWLRSQELRDPR